MSQGTFGPGPSFSDGGPPRRGMSTGTKVLLILGGIFGVLALACCGVGFWIFNKFSKSVTNDPERVVAIQQEMVSIDVPPDLPPRAGMDLDFWRFKIKVAVFSTQALDGQQAEAPVGGGEMLLLMQGAIDDPEAQQQMEARMKSQGVETNMRVESTEVRKIMIGGEEVTFEFSKGVERESGTRMRQVTGTFPGRNGEVNLQYFAAEDAWDEDQVMAMLRSISP